MKDSIWMGHGKFLVPVPHHLWQSHVEGAARHSRERLSFMTPDHHRVRNFAVRELLGFGAPIPPDHIARSLDLPLDRTVQILAGLEKHMTFLFRNEQGAVAWAYPVTVDPTPHRLSFSTGERGYAA